MKLSTFHRGLVDHVQRHGVRQTALAAGVNPMRVSRFCRAKGWMVGRIPIEDWIRVSAVVASLTGRAVELPISELDV